MDGRKPGKGDVNMENQLVKKLWKSSNVLKHYMFQADDLGMAELKPKVAMTAYSSVIIGFVIIAALMGGGF